MSYSAEERESNLNCTDANKSWVLYTHMQSVIGKLKKVGVAPIKIDEDGAHHFRLDFNQVSFRSGKKREMSEFQRKAAAERMRNMHKNKNV